MSTMEQDALRARREANAQAIAVNPVYENERLAQLTSWDAPWAGLRVVVVGMGTSGDAAAGCARAAGCASRLSTGQTPPRSVSASRFTVTRTDR